MVEVEVEVHGGGGGGECCCTQAPGREDPCYLPTLLALFGYRWEGGDIL